GTVERPRHRAERAVIGRRADAAAHHDATDARLGLRPSHSSDDRVRVIADDLDTADRVPRGEQRFGQQIGVGVERVTAEKLIPDGDENRRPAALAHALRIRPAKPLPAFPGYNPAAPWRRSAQ